MWNFSTSGSLTHFGMDVVDPLAIWTGMGAGNEE